MPFYANVGYQFPLPNGVVTDGSVLLASSMPLHQLLRRKRDKHPHLQRLLFDPQLYLATLSPNQSRKQCVNLASYPWFGSASLGAYDSSQHDQKTWRDAAHAKIATAWRGVIPIADSEIDVATREAVSVQAALGCEAIILPSPLTNDPATAYDVELKWLDQGIAQHAAQEARVPVYATIAVADLCLRYADPTNNGLLELMADTVSARGVDGVYIVVEQGGEPAETRQCATMRTLWSLLQLVHLFRADCNLQVVVNFVGSYGLALSAAGARVWASAWYKSLHRLRLADQVAGGRAFPLYWSHASAVDINLERDFDALVGAGLLPVITDTTTASAGLLAAASQGVGVANVPAWRYQQSNVRTAAEHFFLSSVAAEQRLGALTALQDRLDFVEQWLSGALTRCQRVDSALGAQAKSRMTHVSAWLDAVRSHRRVHSI